jgi:hypothetical protein
VQLHAVVNAADIRGWPPRYEIFWLEFQGSSAWMLCSPTVRNCAYVLLHVCTPQAMVCVKTCITLIAWCGSCPELLTEAITVVIATVVLMNKQSRVPGYSQKHWASGYRRLKAWHAVTVLPPWAVMLNQNPPQPVQCNGNCNWNLGQTTSHFVNHHDV